MTRAVWLNDDGTEPEPTPATTTHTPRIQGGRPVTTDDFAKYHHDHVHRSFLDPLTTLRAEVQKWHDQMITVVETYKGAGTREAINNRMTARAEAAAYSRVLDLIDKRMEAGQ